MSLTSFYSVSLGMVEKLLTPFDIINIKYNKNFEKLYYGEHSRQFGHLRLPNNESNKKLPVIVVIHGGCWISKFASVNFMEPFSQELQSIGYAVWNIEYRTSDINGGGWPGTFLDVASSISYLKEISELCNLDLDNITLIGHSSGGHLALWYANKDSLSKDSDIYSEDTIKPKLAVNIAGPTDLKQFCDHEKIACGEEVISNLLLKVNSDNKDSRYHDASPHNLISSDINQVLLVGSKDNCLPVKYLERYKQSADAIGASVKLFVLDDVGHFDFLSPNSESFRFMLKNIK